MEKIIITSKEYQLPIDFDLEKAKHKQHEIFMDTGFFQEIYLPPNPFFLCQVRIKEALFFLKSMKKREILEMDFVLSDCDKIALNVNCVVDEVENKGEFYTVNFTPVLPFTVEPHQKNK